MPAAAAALAAQPHQHHHCQHQHQHQHQHQLLHHRHRHHHHHHHHCPSSNAMSAPCGPQGCTVNDADTFTCKAGSDPPTHCNTSKAGGNDDQHPLPVGGEYSFTLPDPAIGPLQHFSSILRSADWLNTTVELGTQPRTPLPSISRAQVMISSSSPPPLPLQVCWVDWPMLHCSGQSRSTWLGRCRFGRWLRYSAVRWWWPGCTMPTSKPASSRSHSIGSSR